MEPLVKGIKNAVVISDTHISSQTALCPPKMILDGGNPVSHSEGQKKIYRCWREFWDKYVPILTKGEPYIIIANGDILEGRHHNTTDSVSSNLADQIKMAEDLLLPEVRKANAYYHIRGTEAHAGIAGEIEEALAKKLGAIPDGNGKYARWELWLEMGGELIHVSHHIGTTQSMAYESTALMRELTAHWSEAGRWGDKAPSVIIRGHRHRHMKIEVSGVSGLSLVVVTPGWQAKTPYSYRMTLGRTGQPQIGGSVIRAGDEDKLYERHIVWTLKREKTEVV